MYMKANGGCGFICACAYAAIGGRGLTGRSSEVDKY